MNRSVPAVMLLVAMVRMMLAVVSTPTRFEATIASATTVDEVSIQTLLAPEGKLVPSAVVVPKSSVVSAVKPTASVPVLEV